MSEAAGAIDESAKMVLIKPQLAESSPEFGSPLFHPLVCAVQSTRLNQSPES